MKIYDTAQGRRSAILQRLRENSSVSVAQLSEEFGVSEVTIRKDLRILKDRKLLLRVHGGAILGAIASEAEHEERNVNFKRYVNTREKEAIGKAAAAHIKNGDTSEKAERKKSELKFARASVNEAKVFIDSVLFRESTIVKAAQEIVTAQAEFFRKGARYLAPLRQKDIAEKLKVHEATISRMANSKYLSCEWGIFPISYFFTNAVAPAHAEQSEQSGEKSAISKEGVKFEIARILHEHKDDKKALSDQKISDILAEKGITVARRTVAKYRGELNVSSSYER